MAHLTDATVWGTVVTASAVVLAALIAAWADLKRRAEATKGIVTTIEVNTNSNLKAAMDEVAALRKDVSNLVGALRNADVVVPELTNPEDGLEQAPPTTN